MRRSELAGARVDLLDLDAGTLQIEPTRVVVDGKTENAQHLQALDAFTQGTELPAFFAILSTRVRGRGVFQVEAPG
jgi:hypothetical protein